MKYYKTEAEIALVDLRPEIWSHPLFVTISPNPSTMIPIKRRNCINGKVMNCKLPYGKLPQKIQYEYCEKVVRTVYNYSKDTKYFCTWELNTSGNVHFHMIYHDPFITSDVSLNIFRRDVLNHDIVIRNMAKGKKMIDYMNNIVFVTDSLVSRIAYMLKDVKTNLPIFPYLSSD